MACLFVGAFLLPSGDARADEPEAAAETARDPDAELAEALRAYDDGRFAEARRLFLALNRVAPNARTLRALGVISFELGEFEEAHAYLTASLVHPERPLTPELRERVLRLVDATRRHLGRIEIVSAGASVRVLFDGLAVDLDASGGAYVAPGAHVITLVDDEASRVITVEVPAGEVARVDASSRTEVSSEQPPADATRAPEVSHVAVEPPLSEPPPTPRNRRPRRGAIASLSLAAASLVSGTTLLSVARARHGALARTCRDGCSPTFVDDAYDARRIEPLALGGKIMLGVGLVGVATSIVTFRIDRRAARATLVTVGSEGVTCLVAF